MQQGQGSVGSGFVIQDPAKKSKRKRKSSSKEAYTEEGEAKAREQAVGVAGAAAPATAAATEGATGVGEAQKARPVATYLNSPETSIFKKGKNLFGLDLAKEVRGCLSAVSSLAFFVFSFVFVIRKNRLVGM